MSNLGTKLLGAAVVAVGAAALYQGLVTRTYTVDTQKWPYASALRLAVVSDLHSYFWGGEQQTILQMLKQQAPDYILIPGDLFDERVPTAGTKVFLQGACSTAPVFFAPGNHEYRTKQMERVYALVRQCGATTLADAYVTVDSPAGPLVLAGCEDPEKTLNEDACYVQETSMRRAFAPLKHSKAFTVLLAHRPDQPELYRSLEFDLVVSGHAHGGQVRIPWLLNGLYATHQGLFPKYAGGCYHHGRLRQVVSRGASVQKIPRIFNPPELVIINIRGVGFYGIQ